MKSFRFRHSVDIKASAQHVWGVVVDVERWSEFLPTMSRVRILEEGPLRMGSRVSIKQPLQPVNIWTVLSVDEPHFFRWRTGRAWLALVATHQIEPTEQGCRQTLILELEGKLSPLAGLVAGWLLYLVLCYENRQFRRRAESAIS